VEVATSLAPYQRHIAYERTRDFYRWRLSEPRKKFHAATLYDRGQVVGLVFFNKQWGRVLIREVLAKKSAGAGLFALLLHEVVRYCGVNCSYQIWSNLPEPILAALGFADIKEQNEFRHDIAVRGYNLNPTEEKRVQDVFSRARSGLSLLDFDC